MGNLNLRRVTIHKRVELSWVVEPNLEPHRLSFNDLKRVIRMLKVVLYFYLCVCLNNIYLWIRELLFNLTYFSLIFSFPSSFKFAHLSPFFGANSFMKAEGWRLNADNRMLFMNRFNIIRMNECVKLTKSRPWWFRRIACDWFILQLVLYFSIDFCLIRLKFNGLKI